MTPDVTLTGKLQTIAGADDDGTVVITLVNYGSNQPAVGGNSIVSQVVTKVQAAADGTFSVNLWGADQITPQNTLYAIAVYPSASQAVTAVATYKLTSGTYDLSSLVPVVTVLPPAAFIPISSVNGKNGYIVLTAADVNALPASTGQDLISQVSALQTQLAVLTAGFQFVNSTPTTTIDFSISTNWKMTLVGATTVVFTNAAAGPDLTLIITQDSTGNHPVTWAANILGAPSPGTVADGSSVFNFKYDGTNYLLNGSPVVDQTA